MITDRIGLHSVLLLLFIAKYNIFPPADKASSREKKILAKLFAHAISEHYRDFEHANVY